MVYILFDDWLYIDIERKQEVYGRQEVNQHLRSKIKSVTVAFLDYQTRKIPILEQSNHLQERIEESLVDQESVTVQEKISSQFIQMISVKEEKIKAVYDYFRGIRVENLIPYGVAIRALLKSKDILNQRSNVIFLDDLGNQAFVTIFEDMYFTSARRISMRDVGYMISEIRRSWQGYTSEKEQGFKNDFILVSNNQEWLRAFVSQGFCMKEDIIHLDLSFVVLEGLQSAKFTMHFALTQEVLRNKSLQKWQQRFKFSMICMFLILLSIVIYMTSVTLEKKENTKHQSLEIQKRAYQEQIKRLYQQKILTLLKTDHVLSYAKIYYDFFKSIPEGYTFDDIQFKKSSQQDLWQIQGIIYPKDQNSKQSQFQYLGYFLDAKNSLMMVNQMLGQKIELLMDINGEEL